MADQTLEIVAPTGSGSFTLNLAAYGATGISPYTADSPLTFTEDATNLGIFRSTRTSVTSAGLFTGLDSNGSMWHFLLANVTDTYFGSLNRLSPNLLNTTGAMPVNVTQWLGTAPSTPTVAGVPNVNAKTWNDLATVALPLVPTTAGRTLVVDAAGLADANVVKVGPSGSGTAQTAGDIPARLPAALTGDGNIKADALKANGAAIPTNFAALDINASGHVSRVVLTDTLTTYTGNTPQTGDSFVRLGAPSGASVSADIAAVKTDTGNLVTRITSTLFSGITSLAKWLGLLAGKTADAGTLAELVATTAGAGYLNSTDSLEAIRDRGDAAWITGSGVGTGARSVTITVNDGATVLQTAIVRMSQGAESYTATTNVSGVATFSLDDATWTVTITKAGYSFTPTTIIVNGTETQTYSMTAVTVTPATAPGQTTVYGTFYNATGAGEQGVVIDLRLSAFSASAAGLGYDTSIMTDVSDASGNVEFLACWRGAVYEARRRGRHQTWVSFTTASATTSPLPVLIGDDAS